jgi:RNA polymerase-binding protein DksA
LQKKGRFEVAEKKEKTSEKKRTVLRKESNLTREEFEYFKQLLLSKRREIVGNVNEMEDGALKKSMLDASGDLSSMPIHMADLGTDNYEQEFALGLMDSERKLLREIDEALANIELGTYGICQGTGKPISRARLKAKPWAKYNVEYARTLEHGGKTG